MTSYRPVNAVLRGLDVLLATNRLKGRATVGEIHRHTGLDKATIVRMLETLAHAGLIVRNEETRTYEVTGKALLLSVGYDRHRTVSAIVTPIMEEFQEEIGWPSDVAIFDNDAMLLVETSRKAGPMMLNRHPGYRAPILATSLGQVYLAFGPQEEREAVLVQESEKPDPWNDIARDTSKAITFFDDIRKRGYATMHPDYSRIEYRHSMTSLGVPIMSDNKVFASINVLYLKKALTQEQAVKAMLKPLQATARQIAQELERRSEK